MNLALILVFILNIISLDLFALNKTRTIHVATDEVADVKTALGIATKVLLQDNPTSSPIIGDLSGYRIEPVDKGYAVKPLRYGAKTNFFINTNDRSYIVRFTTVNQDLADYVVYLVPRIQKAEVTIAYQDFKRIKKNDDMVFITKRVGKTKDHFIVLEFSILAYGSQSVELDFFRLRQGKDFKTIHSLILSSKESGQNKPILGVLTIKLSDLVSELPANLVIGDSHKLNNLVLEIPRDVLWRR